jgi:hypothetical protein
MIVSQNNMWAFHGLDRFCVRPYSKLGPEFQVRKMAANMRNATCARPFYMDIFLCYYYCITKDNLYTVDRKPILELRACKNCTFREAYFVQLDKLIFGLV